MPSGRNARRLIVLALAVTSILGVAPLRAQQASGATVDTPSSSRGMEFETAGKLREASNAYRAAIKEGALVAGVLGLERVYSMMGRSDSILPLLDTLMAQRPREPVLRTVQLRTLITLRKDDDAKAAFERWVQVLPRDPIPYREYARLLLDVNRTGAADTVLQRAQRVFGTPRDFALEIAQLRASLGLWAQSATAWRDAVAMQPFLDQAAVFSLYPAPSAARDSIRRLFMAPPIDRDSRRILAGLELRWRSPREGWAALRDLPANDSSAEAWISFGQMAEDNEAWLTARDALGAALAVHASDSLALRAATAAMNGGDAAGALQLLSKSPNASASSTAPLRVRALAALGRAEEAEQLVRTLGAADSAMRSQLTREVAWGWVRAGDLPRARRALTAAGGDEDDRISGWIALYAGELGAARRGLKRAAENSGDLVLALSFLSRTRSDSAPVAGKAFLALARGDSVTAAATFVEAAALPMLADAAPLLLATSARLTAARGDMEHARAIWATLVDGHADAPEAAEAELEWARSLRRDADLAAATKHLEHLILTWPQSALVPQARRELDLAKGTVPERKP